jgi:hypothetical protein
MTEASTELVFMTALVILPLIPAVVLFWALPSKGQVSGPFKGLNVKFSGAFAGYMILFGCLLQIRPTDFDHSHVWQVKGRVAFKRPHAETKPNTNDIRVRVTPPDLVVHGDGSGGGSFRFDVPIPEKNGEPDFPRLSLDLAGYEPLSVSLAPDQPGDGSDVEASYDPSKRHISLGTITLRSASLGDAYDEATAQIARAQVEEDQP